MTVNVADWSETPASNGTVDGINIAEGCPAGNVNGAIRSIMAGVKTMYLALPSVAGYVTRTAGSFLTNPTFSGRGGYVHFNDTSLTSGRIFVQPSGGAAPTMANGDILLEY